MHVALLAGGPSAEHEVSLASARTIGAALRERGHQVTEILIDRAGAWQRDGDALQLIPGGGLLDADVAFPALHGRYGEDGTVQGVLEALGLPYVGSGIATSAVCIDKVMFKDLMRAHGIPQVDYVGLGRERFLREPERDDAALLRLGLPVFVKPSRLGSSLGIVKVQQPAELLPAIRSAFEYDEIVIVEAAAPGIEVECALLGSEPPGDRPFVATPGQVKPLGDWYDFAAKYQDGGMDLVIPAPVDEATRERVQALALKAFDQAGCRHLARVDFFVDGDDVLLNELNTMPGFTATSVYPKLMAASGIDYPLLVERLCTLAIASNPARSS